MEAPKPVLNKYANDYTGFHFDDLTDALYYIEAGIDYLHKTVEEGQLSAKQQNWLENIFEAMSCIAYV